MVSACTVQQCSDMIKVYIFFVIALIHPDSIQYIHIADNNREQRKRLPNHIPICQRRWSFFFKENFKIDFNFFHFILITIRNDNQDRSISLKIQVWSEPIVKVLRNFRMLISGFWFLSLQSWSPTILCRYRNTAKLQTPQVFYIQNDWADAPSQISVKLHVTPWPVW